MEIEVKRFWLVGKYISDHFLCKGVCFLFATCLTVYRYDGLRVRLSEVDPSFVKIDLYTIGNVGAVRLEVTISFMQYFIRLHSDVIQLYTLFTHFIVRQARPVFRGTDVSFCQQLQDHGCPDKRIPPGVQVRIDYSAVPLPGDHSTVFLHSSHNIDFTHSSAVADVAILLCDIVSCA